MFQSLAESILILSLAALDLEESFHIFVVLGLTFLPVSCLYGLFSSSWNGWLCEFWDLFLLCESQSLCCSWVFLFLGWCQSWSSYLFAEWFFSWRSCLLLLPLSLSWCLLKLLNLPICPSEKPACGLVEFCRHDFFLSESQTCFLSRKIFGYVLI